MRGLGRDGKDSDEGSRTEEGLDSLQMTTLSSSTISAPNQAQNAQKSQGPS